MFAYDNKVLPRAINTGSMAKPSYERSDMPTLSHFVDFNNLLLDDSRVPEEMAFAPTAFDDSTTSELNAWCDGIDSARVESETLKMESAHYEAWTASQAVECVNAFKPLADLVRRPRSSRRIRKAFRRFVFAKTSEAHVEFLKRQHEARWHERRRAIDSLV